jgi:hypothetical protein
MLGLGLDGAVILIDEQASIIGHIFTCQPYPTVAVKRLINKIHLIRFIIIATI